MKPAPPGTNTVVPPPVPSQATPEAVAAQVDPKKDTKPAIVTAEGPIVPAASMAAATIARTAPAEPSPPPEVTPKIVPEVVDPMLQEKPPAKGVSPQDKTPKPPPEPLPQTYEEAFPPTPGTVANAEEVVGLDQRTKKIPPELRGAMPTPPPVVPSTGGAPIPETDADARRGSAQSIDPDKEPQDALLDAAWDGDIDAVARALRHAPATSCDLRGLTALHLASERDHLAIAIMLLDRGADVHARANGGRMALHLAARFATADTVEMLLERAHANPNAETSDGRTPLHYAASAAEDGDEDRREVIRVLRDFGADPTIEDRKGNTARDVAQKRDFWDAAATLKRAEKHWDEDHNNDDRHQNWLQRHGFMK